ncbi:MAG: glycoside hydrolase family 88 protein [Demequinaceae bacterium]|nr:glycoside hydrolase family 88 protein [Demequinaceae bacterium]
MSDPTDGLDDRLWHALLAMQRHPWEQGVASHAAIDSHRIDLARLLAHDAIVRQDAEGRLAATGDAGLVNGAACGEAVALVARGGDPAASVALDRQAMWLAQVCPRGESGILFHMEGRPEVWVDTVYMVVPFLVAIGRAESAETQYRLHKDRLWIGDSGLWGHIYDDGASAWVRQDAWASGNGWVAAGLARALRIGAGWLDADVRMGWREDARALLEAVAPHEREDGRFSNVLDDASAFRDGTAGLMFAYAAFTGVADGWLDSDWVSPARRWMEASLAKVGEDGLVGDVCGAPRFDRQGTSAEAQAFALLARVAARRAEARQQSTG